MIITKVITVGLNIRNFISVYTDLNNNVMNILRNHYEKHCTHNCYILSIKRIIRVSDCYINQDGNPSFGTLNVIFEAAAIEYSIGEIINGATVISRDNRTIICGTEYASIMLNMDDTLGSVKEGQKISVRVGGARYNIGADKISVNATPFAYMRAPIMYKIPAADTIIDSSIMATIEPILENIRAEESLAARVREENPKSWEFFSQLLYKYKDEQKKPGDATEINLWDGLKNGFPFGSAGTIYIGRDPRIHLWKPTVYCYSGPAVPPDAKVQPGRRMDEILINLFTDYLCNLKMIRELIEIYKTPEDLHAHMNIWMIFKKAKA